MCVVGVPGEPDPDRVGDAVDGDVGDAGQGVGDQLAVRAAVVRIGAEGEADVLGLADGQADPDREQVALRDHVLARVLQRPDDHDTDGAALGQQQRQGGVDPLPHGAVGDPGGQRGQLVDDHHDQRLDGGRGVQAGVAAEPVGAAAHLGDGVLEQLGERGLVAEAGGGVAVGEPVEQRPAGGQFHAALGVDHPQLDQPGPDQRRQPEDDAPRAPRTCRRRSGRPAAHGSRRS